jgi:O-antigen ligase
MAVPRKSDSTVQKIFLATLIVATIAITPYTSYEPFNSPKFFLISILACGFLFLLLFRGSFKNFYDSSRSVFILTVLFLVQSLIVLFIGPTLITQQLFGANGRNTGFILYIILLALLVSTYVFCTHKFYYRLVISLIITGLLNTVYGILQYFGLDPFNWTNPYNPVFGFFGNPNFQSAFLGLASAPIWALFFDSTIVKRKRYMLIFLASLNLIIIISTSSQQGLIVFVAGFFIVLLAVVVKLPRVSKYAKYIGLSTLLIATLAVLDILQKLPWRSILYKESVSNRGDLWRAAWNMGVEYPLTGVGFDGYGYFYRQHRDLTAIVERGVGTTSNSAHNVYLDVLANGGFPLLVIYLSLLALVLKSAYIGMKRSKNYDPIFTALVASWICYQLQAVISINQIGVAAWGWVLSGAILGYERISRSNQKETEYVKHEKGNKVFFGATAGVVFGALIAVPPILADTNFRSALDSKQIELVLDSAYKWPQSPETMFQVAALFRQNDLLDLSAQIAKDATSLFPRSYENWELLTTLSNLSVIEKNQAYSQMRKLDPLNQTIR